MERVPESAALSERVIAKISGAFVPGELPRGILDEAYEHADDPGVLNETDARFHVAVAEASKNLVLVRVMFTLLDLLATIRPATRTPPARRCWPTSSR